MRTAGLMMNDVWAHRVLRERGVQTVSLQEVPAEIDVLVESVELRHHEQDRKYRPYLHVSGELRAIRPGGQLPYGISELTYSAGQGEVIDAFYEFDDKQLVDLAAKGYFQEGFCVPEGVTGFDWELPASIDVVMLEPTEAVSGAEVPVVFTHIRDRGGLSIDLESTGYELAEYFEDYSRTGVAQVQVEDVTRDLKSRSDQIDPLFEDSEFEVEAGQTAEGPQETGLDELAGVESHKHEIEQAIEAEREQFRAARAAEGGTAENLYAERVAKSLASREEGPAETVEDEQAKISFAERKRQVSRRAAELTHDESGPDRQY